MSTRAKKPPAFPTNYGWVMSNAHQYSPRNCSREVYHRLCETILRVDSDFIHLLRQCTDRWIISVVLGHTTMHLNVYDPEQVDDTRSPERSQPASLEQAIFLEVDRHLNLQRISAERIARVKRTHPMFYAVRHLRPQDTKMLDSMQVSLTGDLGVAKAAGPVNDILAEIRQAQAEPVYINRTPLLRRDDLTPTTKE